MRFLALLLNLAAGCSEPHPTDPWDGGFDVVLP